MKFFKKFFQILLVLLVVAVTGFTGFWFSRPADVLFEEHKAEIPNAEYSKFAEINGVRLHYQEKGEGTPLVLIHGYTSLHYTWNKVFEPLSKKFRVISVDLKGFGFSAKPDGDYTRREQAVLVRGLLDHLKIEKAWLAGSSMGGEVSLNVALQEPKRVEGLILIGSAGVKFEARSRSSADSFKIPFLGRVFASLLLLSEDAVRNGLKRSYFDDSKITAKDVRLYHIPLTSNNGQRAAARAIQQWGLHPVENELGKINVPALIVWGAEDRVVPLEAGQKMNSLIENSELKVYENIGHLPQEESPQRVVEDIFEFTGSRKL
jgi:pimeloyl-ACP methyl ester carboxylesterase